MLQLKQGTDILAAVGGLTDEAAVHEFLTKRLDEESREKLARVRHPEVRQRIANAIAMTDPARVFIHTGSAQDRQTVREMSLTKGEEAPLARLGHTIHFDLPEDQARLVDRTFYIVNEGEEVSSLAKKELRAVSHEHIQRHMRGIARGKTLLVGFFSRGPIGAPAALPALEITTSTYVMHSADILYRHCYEAFDREVGRVGHVITNVHGEGPNRPENLPDARIYMDRSWLTTYAMFCTYAGNTLLLKKGNHRFAVDLATYFKRGQELSEHMFITGMTGPGGRKTYFAGAAPSGCGKTTTAMVGTDFIGDDLAQLWIADDGSLRAINPECGIFGIVKDVNREGDPFLMEALRGEGAEVIWSNVLVDESGVPHWEGNGEAIPKSGVNFQGPWFPGKRDAAGHEIPLSHPNSRCTLSCEAIGNYNRAAAEDPAGVVIRVITYSGRDRDTMPPVVVARNPEQGVVIGASILSQATATEVGVSGVRRQPWANQPFIPGPLGDYMAAQFEFFCSPRLREKPVIASLNYFLTEGARGGQGERLLGEKRDVRVWLGWLELRAHEDVEAIETPIGFLPCYEDLKRLFSAIGKEYPRELYDRQFALYIDNIVAKIDLQREAFAAAERIPETLFTIYEAQKRELLALKEKFGPVVAVEFLAR